MSVTSSGPGALAERARILRELHVPGRPLLLPNAWDAASAAAVVRAGFPAVATASAAVSSSLGYPDGERMPVAEMFAAIARIAGAVAVPVTADVEAGYGLSPDDLVGMLVEAGAAGCNIEDTDHRGGGLIEAEAQAARIAGVRGAARRASVPLVVNARVDVYLHEPQGAAAEPADLEAEALRRARLYLDAGADCVYPIRLGDEAVIGRLVPELGGMVNLLASPTAPPLPRLISLGVARISFGPWVQRLAMREAEAVLRDVAAGADPFEGRVR